MKVVKPNPLVVTLIVVSLGLFITVVYVAVSATLNYTRQSAKSDARNATFMYEFLERIRRKIVDAPDLVDLQQLVLELKGIAYPLPSLLEPISGGYSCGFDNTIVAKPIPPDAWELTMDKRRVAVIGPRDTKMFIFEGQKQLDELPAAISSDLQIVLFAKQSVLVIKPSRRLYSPIRKVSDRPI
ncbi:MAG: hypothetical protein K2X81_04350 [Candidatus Obscuribacterales bacterium]|nr:hypothetical protein [Candidatus Obscuribacterales bacterium]